MNICERKYYLLAYANDKNYVFRRVCPQGGVSQHALRQTLPTPTPSRRLLLRTVRILLECILVFHHRSQILFLNLNEIIFENKALTIGLNGWQNCHGEF